jgi:hypothetical protein
VILHWQIQRDLAQARLDDLLREARSAAGLGGPQRRPMRRIAAAARWASDRFASAVPRRAAAKPAEAGRLDIRVTVSPLD